MIIFLYVAWNSHSPPLKTPLQIKYVNRTSWGSELLKFGPTLLLIGFWLFVMRGLSSSAGGPGGMGGGMKNIFQIGKSPAVRATKDAKNKVALCPIANML